MTMNTKVAAAGPLRAPGGRRGAYLNVSAAWFQKVATHINN